MPVRKAVIPAAGFGTRFLPATKAIPKMMLPVVDRPLIQYAVEELAKAGIDNICLVVSRGSESIADHFGVVSGLESALESKGKRDLLEEVTRLNDLAKIYLVRQEEALGLGHAVSMAREYVGEEPFVVALPDEIFDPASNNLAEMIGQYDETGSSVVSVTEVASEDIKFYGAIETPDKGGNVLTVNSVVEKPDPSAAPSNFAVIGRYVLEPDIFEILEKTKPGACGEIQLTDGLDALARGGRLSARLYKGRRWDAGKKDTYLQAVVALASERADLGPEFRKFLRGFDAS